MSFRSKQFVVGDFVKPNFNNSEHHGIGFVTKVEDDIQYPAIHVMWNNTPFPVKEHFTDIILVEAADNN